MQGERSEKIKGWRQEWEGVDHPLDRRLGAGHYNEAQWTAMASDGRIAPERAALQQGQTRGVDLDRPSGELIHEEPEIVHRLPALLRELRGLRWFAEKGCTWAIDQPYGPQWLPYPALMRLIRTRGMATAIE